MQSIHGSFSISTLGKLTKIIARGPWNHEFVQSFINAYRAAADEHNGEPWFDLVTLEGESLFVPDAERLLTLAMGLAKQRGLICSAIVMGQSTVRNSAQHQFQRMLSTNDIVHCFFDTEAQACVWLAQNGWSGDTLAGSINP